MRILDTWLIRQARGGSPDAFAKLYDRHARRVFHLLRRLTGGDAAAAEDLTQDTFVAAYQALGSWRGVGKFSTYLCAIAVRQYRMSYRRTLDTLPLDDFDPAADPAVTALAHCTRAEAEQALEAAIADLPVLIREALVLVRVESMRYQYAADLI